MTDYPCILVDMPTRIKSFVRRNPDGSKTIVINARLNYESRLERYKHEVDHIESKALDRDVDREASADQIELVAHKLATTTPPASPNRRRKRKRRKSSKWQKQQNVMRALGISVDPWAEHERLWLDPEWRVY